MSRSGKAAQFGFTLIEIAIVLVVVGLLISGSISALGPLLAGQKSDETKKRADMVEQAIIAYVVQHGCLPCPATAASGTSNWSGAGTGPCDAGTCTTPRGYLPYTTLGLQRKEGLDAWGTRFSYSITTGLAQTGGMNRSGTNYAPVGTLTVNDAAGTAITTAAAYVLISHGKNRGFGANNDGNTIAGDATHLNEAENAPADADNVYVQDDPRDINDANYFDDMVFFRTKPILVQLCGAGACGNPS